MRSTVPWQQRHALLVMAAGTIATALIVLVPELVPLIAGRDGQVWTLFNSSNYRAGDMYYYAPMIQQVLAGHVPPFPPNAAIEAGAGSPEHFRWLGYVIAAIPGLLIDDPRAPLVWALVLPAIAGFAVAMAFARTVTGRVWMALLVGILATFYFQFWQIIPVLPDSVTLSGLGKWWHLADLRLDKRMTFAEAPYDSYRYSDMFRFLLPSLSFVLLAAFALLLVQVDRHRRVWLTIIAIPAACLMAFSYPSHALIAYLLLVGFAAANLMARDWSGLRDFMAIGLTTLAFLAVAGIPELLSAGFAEDTFISAVYSPEDALSQNHIAWTTLPSLLISKYTVSFVIALALAWGQPLLRRVVAIVGIIAIVLSLTALLPPIYSGRFLGRGIDHLWFIVLAAVFLDRLAALFDRLNAASSGIVGQKGAGVAAIVAAGLLFALPAVGFTTVLRNNLDSDRRFVPLGQWDAYAWLHDNADGEMVAALNWPDIEFIAVYLPNVRTVFGNADLANRRPEVEFPRFVATWKALGLSRSKLEDWARRAVTAEMERRMKFAKNQPAPFLSEDDYAASRLAQALVYYPYISEFEGGPVATVEGTDRRSSDRFVANVLKLYDQAPAEFLVDLGVSTLVLSPFEKTLISVEALAGWQPVYENDQRSIYRRKQ
jgi:hypothetical protein